MPQNKAFDRAAELAANDILNEWDELDKQIHSSIVSHAGRLQVDPDTGRYSPTADNLFIEQQLRSRIDKQIRDFTTDHIAGARYLANLGSQEAPNTTLGDIGQLVTDLSRERYEQFGVDENIVIAKHLFNAAQSVKTASSEITGQVNRLFQSGMLEGKRPGELITSLMDLGLKKSHAATVQQGMTMELYQSVQNDVARSMDTEYFEYTGPPPVQGKNGHLWCQENYLKVMTRDEWNKLAQKTKYHNKGFDPDKLFIYRGGYGCHHTFDAVAADQVDEVIEDNKELEVDYEEFKASEKERLEKEKEAPRKPRTVSIPKETKPERIARQKAERQKIVEKEARQEERFQNQWVHGSKRKEAVKLKQAVKDVFKTQGVPYSRTEWKISDKEGVDARKTAKRIYDRTQAFYKKKGVKSIKLYRGVKDQYATVGTLESWTTDLAIAKKFAGRGKNSRIIEMVIPVDRLFQSHETPGWVDGKYGNQSEYIVMAPRR